MRAGTRGAAVAGAGCCGGRSCRWITDRGRAGRRASGRAFGRGVGRAAKAQVRGGHREVACVKKGCWLQRRRQGGGAGCRTMGRAGVRERAVRAGCAPDRRKYRAAVVVVGRVDERRRQGSRRGPERRERHEKDEDAVRQRTSLYAQMLAAQHSARICVRARKEGVCPVAPTHHHTPSTHPQRAVHTQIRGAWPPTDRPTPGPISEARGQSGGSRMHRGTAIPDQDEDLIQGPFRVSGSV